MISLSSIVGILLGLGVVLYSMHRETNNLAIFFSQSSLLIVLGGTITVTFIGFRAKYVWNAFVALFKIYLHQSISPKSLQKDVAQAIEWSRRVQVDGNRALDAISHESKDDFIKYLYGLASTGYTIEDIRLFGETNIEETYFRRLQSANILSTMGSMTPALGLVGTLLGLITMLSKLDDPSKLGPGLSMALTATLYGLLFARFFFLPSSTKTKQTLSIERFRQYLQLEGLVLLMERRPSLYIQDRLNSFLDRSSQYSAKTGV